MSEEVDYRGVDYSMRMGFGLIELLCIWIRVVVT